MVFQEGIFQPELQLKLWVTQRGPAWRSHLRSNHMTIPLPPESWSYLIESQKEWGQCLKQLLPSSFRICSISYVTIFCVRPSGTMPYATDQNPKMPAETTYKVRHLTTQISTEMSITVSYLTPRGPLYGSLEVEGHLPSLPSLWILAELCSSVVPGRALGKTRKCPAR